MDKQKIEELIIKELPFSDQEIALDFVKYLHDNGMDFIRDKGYWKDKIYYIINFNNKCVCCIAINDPDEKENRWTVWSDDMSSEFLGNFPIKSELKEIAWRNVDHCGNCGSCSGGRKKVVFGKTFEDVCGCTFRFDNPNADELEFMKKMVEIRKTEILKNINCFQP